MSGLSWAVLAAWGWIALFRGGFWRCRETDAAILPAPAAWPAVTAVVPARDEAAVIGRTLGSLLVQDYPGDFRVILVDDNSRDGTAAIARALPSARLTVIDGAPLAPGWTGKLWAVEQGVRAAARGAGADYLWLTDADIAHTPDTLRSLVARAQADGLVLNSLMARLRTDTWAERAVVPAFVWFFAMLYPFAWVNGPGGTAAAAGGCMLVRSEGLHAAGGVAAIRGALIDDCTLGRLMKRHGRIRLSLTHRSVSVRPYTAADLWRMIARSAYAQLGYSPLLLAGTLAGLLLLFAAPVLLAGRPPALAAWALMALMFQPMLRFYRLSPLWGLALPFTALFYAAATFGSALAHWRGRGGLWKGRVQAALG